MELFPEVQPGLLNGWIPLALLVITDVILFLAFQRGVVRRLFDRSGWTPRQKIITAAGKGAAFGVVLIIILTPLKLGSPLLWIGAGLVGLGLAGLVKALFDFRDAPPDQPATTGIYRFIRHPQNMASSLVILGCTIAVGSWTALIGFFLARILLHENLVAEEQACLTAFGDAYQNYLDQTPRYFLF